MSPDLTAAVRRLESACVGATQPHDVATVRTADLARVLSALMVLRSTYEAQTATIEALMRPMVEPRLCTRPTCPDEMVKKGAGL